MHVFNFTVTKDTTMKVFYHTVSFTIKYGTFIFLPLVIDIGLQQADKKTTIKVYYSSVCFSLQWVTKPLIPLS